MRSGSGKRRRRGALDLTSAFAGAAVAVFLGGCAAVGLSGSGVSFATEPPGARVLVDRRDSGFVTPCRLTLDRKRHHVDLELPGYATASLRIDRGFSTEIVMWRDMYVRAEVWRFPTWLNLEDALWPVKPRFTLAPGHVFVRLERASPARPPQVSLAEPARASPAEPPRALLAKPPRALLGKPSGPPPP